MTEQEKIKMTRELIAVARELGVHKEARIDARRMADAALKDVRNALSKLTRLKSDDLYLYSAISELKDADESIRAFRGGLP